MEREILEELVDLARLSASATNRQPLKYFLSCDAEQNARIFPHLGFARRLKDWPGPTEGERPAAYVIILGDTEIAKSFSVDHGIAAQSILLGAREKGFAGCMHGWLQRDKLRVELNIQPRYEILLVVTLGKPNEKIVLEEIESNGDISYWRDSDEAHHVPKRRLKDIIID